MNVQPYTPKGVFVLKQKSILKAKLAIPEQRMLKLMEWAVKNNIAESESQYWQKIGFPRTNITNVNSGKQGFTRNHIFNACKLTGASTDWIFGLSPTMFREGTAKTPAALLRQVVAQLENKNGKG